MEAIEKRNTYRNSITPRTAAAKLVIFAWLIITPKIKGRIITFFASKLL